MFGRGAAQGPAPAATAWSVRSQERHAAASMEGSPRGPRPKAAARCLLLAQLLSPRFDLLRPDVDRPITLAHFSVLLAMSLPKSAGEPASTAPPRSASRALILGSARPALISLVERLDDFGGRIARRAEAVKGARARSRRARRCA